MDNVQTTVSGDKLTIVVDLSKSGVRSASGKSVVVASTRGNAPIEDHPEFRFGLNVYRKPDGAAA